MISGKKSIIKAIILAALFTSTPLFATEATVVSVIGKAEVKTENQWIPLRKGDKIYTGDVISTGFKSEITFKIDASIVTVKPLSRVSIDEISENKNLTKTQLFLDAGSIKADIKAPEDKRASFKVTCPSATASVRGTAGEFDAFGKLQSTRGAWSYTAGNFSRPSASGSSSDITPTYSQIAAEEAALKAAASVTPVDSTETASGEPEVTAKVYPEGTVQTREVIVRAGQTVSFNVESTSLVSAQKNAAKAAVSMPQNSVLPSVQEKQSIAKTGTAIIEAETNSANTISTIGNIVVNITLED